MTKDEKKFYKVAVKFILKHAYGITIQEAMKALNLTDHKTKKAIKSLQEKGYFRKNGHGARVSTIPVKLRVYMDE